MKHTDAYNIVRELGLAIKPFTEDDRLHIAGSIRREAVECGDGELLCRPLIIDQVETDLFGESKVTKIIHPGFMQAINSMGTVIAGKPDGRHMKIQLPGLKVDMFMPQAEDYFRQYCIRTGSKDFVYQKIAAQWVRKGWCGVNNLGLRLQKDCRREMRNGKPFWILIKENAEKPPAWTSEPHFFTWLGLDYIPAKHRNL